MMQGISDEEVSKKRFVLPSIGAPTAMETSKNQTGVAS